MGTILSEMVLPQMNNSGSAPLYYRTDGTAEVQFNELTLRRGGVVRFNTYFNGFFYPKYLRYTTISEVSFHLSVTGQALIKEICLAQDGQETLIYETHSSGEKTQIELPSCPLDSLPAEGMLFLEIEACSETVTFHCGRVETEQTAYNQVNVAAVICTYRREEYVLRNLEQFQKEIWSRTDSPIRENFTLFVVDNGNTLTQQQIETDSHISLFPNRNYGGSGGFTRGLLEAYKRRDQFTHVLFMDDDISLETDVFVKMIQLLKFAKKFDRPLWIGGQMLIENNPTVQFEAGSFYRGGRLEAVGRGVDLSHAENLLTNAKECDVHFNAWWYCCFPINCVDLTGLPLPLFIKTDDVEYGLRNRPQVLLMNGIGIWHMEFAQKYSPHLEYYIKRNELIVSALHGDGAWQGSWKLIRAAGKAILIGTPKTVNFLLQAYRDFLRGPDFFFATDEEALNISLMNENKQPSKSRAISLLTDPIRLLPALANFMVRYRAVRRSYQNRMHELTTVAFWEAHLGLTADKPNR